MSDSRPLPIRLSSETIHRLDVATRSLNLGNRSQVIKLCLLAFLEAFERDSHAVLPLNWRRVLAAADGRRLPLTEDFSSPNRNKLLAAENRPDQPGPAYKKRADISYPQPKRNSKPRRQS